MHDTAHRGANGVFAVAALVVLLSVVMASQVPPPPPQPPQGRGQAPPSPERFTIALRDVAEGVISSFGLGSFGKMSEMRVTIPAGTELSEARVELGRRLFFDGILSKDRSVSCSTCHKPERAFADERQLAVGIFGRIGKRHSPSIVNRGLGSAQFWDGRAASLEALALMPLRDVNEMDLPPEEAVARLNADGSYRPAFQAAFGGPATTEDLGRALASFVRVVRSENAPYDRFVAGDKTSFTEEQQKGLLIFRAKGRCTFCHREPTFTDEQFHNTGVAWRPAAEGSGGAFQDDGQFAVSKIERTRGAFKTPTLREIGRTAPYMHDGSLATLDDVVEFYNKGGRPNPNLFPIIRPLNLADDEKRALVKFLESLSGEVTSTVLGRDRTAPDFSGTWTPVPATSTGETEPPPAPWSGASVTIVQNLGSVTIQSMIAGARPPLARRLYNLGGSEVTITNRSLPAGSQRLTTRGSWKDWQLVLTEIQFVPVPDAAPSKQEITQVLTLDSPTTLTVQITRQGTKIENWTVKLQRPGPQLR